MAVKKATRKPVSHRRVVARARKPKTRISDGEKWLYIAVLSFAVALTGMMAHGASFAIGEWPAMSFRQPSREVILPAGGSSGGIYARAMALNARYDSRPYWHGSKLVSGATASRETADLAIEHLIPCESDGKTVNRIDTNGKMSYGILQFQDWGEWERISGIQGNPDNRADAIRMAEWGIEHGMIDHWTCARILGED
jgi:hypothetical protein